MRDLKFILILLIFAVILSGCVTKQRQVLNNYEVQQDVKINDFSIIIDDKPISLKSWDKDIDLYSILGQPLSENIEVLGNGADTHTGSFIKTLLYDGLIINLFSPKDNGKEFWIMNMTLTNQKFLTPKGISIGSTIAELKKSYSNIIQAQDGRTEINNCAYTINSEDEYIWFEVENGVVKEIKLYIEIP